MYGWKIAKRCVSNLNCKQEVIEKRILSEIYFLLSLSSVGLTRRFVPLVKFKGDTSIGNMTVAGKEKTAGAEWSELVGMLKEQRKSCFTVIFFFPSSDNDGKDRENSLVANGNGKVLKLLWNITWMWNQCIVVTERSHVILPIYNYQIWGIEGISFVICSIYF